MSTIYKQKHDLQDLPGIQSKLESFVQFQFESVKDVEDWLKDLSVFFDEIQEILSGHYIEFQARNQDETAKRNFEYDQEKIEPLLKTYMARLDEKLMNSDYKDMLDQEQYGRLLRSKENAIKLFREDNISLEVVEDRLATRYFELTGGLTSEWDGEEKTIPELFPYLEDPNRDTRKEAFEKIFTSLVSVENELQEIMDELIKIRKKKAMNSDLNNYRDFMFMEYERFDYSAEDCKVLAESIREHVLPVVKRIEEKKKIELGVDALRPYDLKAVPAERKPLKPFSTRDELVERTARALGELDPRFAELVALMNESGMLDLETRKNKSPGGFCTSLPVSELSFIFMNASHTHDDMLTLFHEMGHCIHNDMKRNLPLSYDRDTPMESSELASMTMELLTMDQWHYFYSKEEQKQAKLDMLRRIVTFLPDGIRVDQFQHWMYENPDHTPDERMEKYAELSKGLSSHVVDWSGYEDARMKEWLFVLHIFEVPFYYVEYVIAQLGALQMYKKYKEDPVGTLKRYKKALSLGNTKSLYEVYEAAGIRFDFSGAMIKDLMEFVENEINELEKMKV
ncbi:oligoendopeptidase F [Bacillus mesophilus]|uniref:M3 family oligoendopeptidase n=1 Tax=Bacillus mesophilus TaxID=1808955 RepID=A0A6M0QC64_9BACI|nr:M3 family oligoendopeptidase [Bacillus mesophilus]MBM7663209.1 oligoendopeptidase F [Bacillus mesophilus]NEY73952.1 M3 family oligoendopeptidase [Bacillus mesophilus]